MIVGVSCEGREI